MPGPSSDEYRLAFAIGQQQQQHCSPTLLPSVPYPALSSPARIPTCELSCSCSSALSSSPCSFSSSFFSSSFKSFAPRCVCRAGSVMGRAGRYHRQDTIKRGDGKHGDISGGTEKSTLLDGWPTRRNRVTSAELTKWRGRARTCSTLCCLHQAACPSLLVADKVTDL